MLCNSCHRRARKRGMLRKQSEAAAGPRSRRGRSPRGGGTDAELQLKSNSNTHEGVSAGRHGWRKPSRGWKHRRRSGWDPTPAAGPDPGFLGSRGVCSPINSHQPRHPPPTSPQPGPAPCSSGSEGGSQPPRARLSQLGRKAVAAPSSAARLEPSLCLQSRVCPSVLCRSQLTPLALHPPPPPPARRGCVPMARAEAIPAAAIMIHKEADLFLTSPK